MAETIGERLPGAVARVGRILGGDGIHKLNKDLAFDLMALHAAAEMWLKANEHRQCVAETESEESDEA